MKPLTKKQLQKTIGQDVLITYNPNCVVLMRILDADETGIVVESDTGSKAVSFASIKDIFWKNIRFINPKDHFDKKDDNYLNVQMDKVNTQIIEKIKDLPRYYLCTRSSRFIKNGSFQKEKITQKAFELEVFHWVKKRKDLIELCPLALLNNELLLTLYQKRFLVLKKNFSMVFDTEHSDINTIVEFIFDENEKIIEKRNTSLRGIAEDFLAEDFL